MSSVISTKLTEGELLLILGALMFVKDKAVNEQAREESEVLLKKLYKLYIRE